MLFIIAMLLSADAVAAGLSYGIKKIKIPFSSKIIIGLCTAFGALISITLGNKIMLFVSPFAAKAAGSFIFFALGIWFLMQTLIPEDISDGGEIYSHAVKSLGITIMIVKNPEMTDINKSGTIDGKEAFIIGIALAADVLAAGIGFGLAGADALTIAFAAGVFQVIFLSFGIYIGTKFRRFCGTYSKLSAMLPGIIMIILGIYRLAA